MLKGYMARERLGTPVLALSYRLFLCLNSIFHLMVPPKGYVFGIIHDTESFPDIRAACTNGVWPPLRPVSGTQRNKP